jgi:pimeloyl-ACP methyl ester carboxylesterase
MAKPKDQSLAGNRPVVIGRPAEIRPGRTLDIAIQEGGERRETTLFFTHGMGGNKNQWRNQWLAFAEMGYRLVAWDGLGHGASPDGKRWKSYSGREFIADYRAILEHYHSDRNVLIGHSYGTTTTLAVLGELANLGREPMVDRAILLGPPRPGPFPRIPVMHLPTFMLEWMRPQFAVRFTTRAWSEHTDRAVLLYEAKQTERNTMFMIKALSRQAPWINPAKLGGINTPIMILAGSDDLITPVLGAQQVAAFLAHAEVKVLRNCGHQIMLEQPAETTELIANFIA